MNLKQTPIIEQDLVLINIEDKPAFYGRVEKITTDVKPKWWRVQFLFLTFPVQVTTWILDEEQIRGADFTMGGTPLRIEKVVAPEEVAAVKEETDSSDKITESKKESPKKARMLSLHKKK